MLRYIGYWDRKQQKFVEELPPVEEKFGQAPMIKMGSLRPQRHPATGMVCETVRQWDDCDRAAGTHTSGHREEVKKPDSEAKVRKDLDQALEKAVNQVDWGMAKMTEQQKAAHKQQNDLISSAYGIDAHNILGSKK
jgi:hypothetical protein